MICQVIKSSFIPNHFYFFPSWVPLKIFQLFLCINICKSFEKLNEVLHLCCEMILQIILHYKNESLLFSCNFEARKCGIDILVVVFMLWWFQTCKKSEAMSTIDNISNFPLFNICIYSHANIYNPEYATKNCVILL